MDSIVRRYRYGVELDRAKKPCLKAVLQGDASAARPMVLCVSRVYTPEELGGRGGSAAAIVEVCTIFCGDPPLGQRVVRDYCCSWAVVVVFRPLVVCGTASLATEQKKNVL